MSNVIKNRKCGRNILRISIFLLMVSPAAYATDPAPVEGSSTQGMEEHIALCEQHVEAHPEEAAAMLQGKTCAEFYGVE